MAPIPLKQEFVGEYVHGMGTQFYLIQARSAEEIRERYPLLDVHTINASTLPAERLEMLRMYPGPDRPLDHAVPHRSAHEREVFVAAAMRQREDVRGRHRAAKLPMPDREAQYWVDIDDDADFRVQMQELWKDDIRYRELPPERRLF